MTITRFSLLFALFIVVACGKKTTQTTTMPTPKPATTTTKVEPTITKGEVLPPAMTNNGKVTIPDGVEPNLVASLKRSPCFGKCPSFEMQLFNDGKAIYIGYSDVAMLGRYEVQTTPEFAKTILAQAAAVKYMSLKDTYPEGNMAISDVPTTFSYIRIGNNGKRITNNHDAPTQLIEFERFMEAQFYALKWQKTKD
jgi:hypothetical protein